MQVLGATESCDRARILVRGLAIQSLRLVHGDADLFASVYYW